MGREAYHSRLRTHGVNKPLYWALRLPTQPLLFAYFRLRRIGRLNIPREGAAILAANHRSFLDPFVISMLTRRPIYYVAKKELFEKRGRATLMNSLGAFPIDRGNSDQEAVDTARMLLERGELVLIFPEGTRVRPGPLGAPKRGIGRLALETGVPVVPIAVHGTEALRKGWRVYPHKVQVRATAPIAFPRVESPSQPQAAAVTNRIWPSVELAWESLGGEPSRALECGPDWPSSKPGRRTFTLSPALIQRRRRDQREQVAAGVSQDDDRRREAQG
jgi:glycerol-3-phosphate dehydrogenase (NAD(P)+)